MQKIVMIYHEGDNCTYGCTVVLPILEIDTATAYVNFTDACKANKGKEFVYCGHTFTADDFSKSNDYFGYAATIPEFLTIDEWFDREQTMR